MRILRHTTCAQKAWLALEALVALAATLFVFLDSRGDSRPAEDSVSAPARPEATAFRQRLADRFYEKAAALGWEQIDRTGTTNLSLTDPPNPAVPIVLNVARPGQSDQYSLLIYQELGKCLVLRQQVPNVHCYQCQPFPLHGSNTPPSREMHSVSAESGPFLPEAEELMNLLRRCLKESSSDRAAGITNYS
jgi:hypothetical protein